MKGKQSELNNSISAAKLSAAEAQAAQQKAQAAIESDELNYEAVKKEIQKLIAAASASKPQLSFNGFACPLKSYSRISSENISTVGQCSTLSITKFVIILPVASPPAWRIRFWW